MSRRINYTYFAFMVEDGSLKILGNTYKTDSHADPYIYRPDVKSQNGMYDIGWNLL